MRKKILAVLAALFGLVMVNAGLNIFFQYMPMPEDMPEGMMQQVIAMMQMKWVMPLTATFEIIGGLLFMIPRFRALGALVCLPLLAGILSLHATVDPATLGMPLVMTAIEVWAIVEDYAKYKPLIR
ncbi:MAG: DoxX family protein [Flavobacteriales bacterium]|nr:DoxX family protein [Flavobacteriales bacterium]MCB9448360.1 DoxX family protein [Flavobacteriales bacterium]